MKLPLRQVQVFYWENRCCPSRHQKCCIYLGFFSQIRNGCSWRKISWQQPELNCFWEGFFSCRLKVYTLSPGLTPPGDQGERSHWKGSLFSRTREGRGQLLLPYSIDQEGRGVAATALYLFPQIKQASVLGRGRGLFAGSHWHPLNAQLSGRVVI